MFMEYGKIFPLDKPIARLVQGTVMISTNDLDGSLKLLDDIFALGGNTFDTAHGYGSGSSERALGRWLKARGNRDDVVIITKGAHHNQDRRRVTPYDISADLHDSLARLGVDFIDIYLLHRDDPSVPVGPIVDVLNKHQAAGKIGIFGGSNWSHERIRAANDYAAANGLNGFYISSPQLSLAEQIHEPWPECVSVGGPAGKAALSYYAEADIPLFTWSSLAGGFFSGRFTRDNLDSFTEYLDKLCVTSYCSEDNFRRLDRAQDLARQKDLTLPQIALAYVLSQPLTIHALVGCANQREFAENIAAMAVRLSPQEMAWLELETDEVIA
jgi:aryl-alcohol dehydrogenase-like predicted oxidoreductase